MAVITICRGTRSGGRALAECVAESFGYPNLGREIIQSAATELGVSEELLRRRMDEAPRLWDRHATIRRTYVVALQAALAERIVTGDLVYHGLAGQFLLRGLPAILRVRLIAPLESRIGMLMEMDRMERSAAETYIRQQDALRARWVKMMYGEDIADPHLYDLVVNLETMSAPVACRLLEATLQQPDFEVTEAVQARFVDFRLACRVKLALVRDQATQAYELQVEASGGTVEVSGSAPMLSSGETGDRIATIAHSVPGVKTVRLKLLWFDPGP